MHSGELLQTSHWPEALYGPLPSRMQAGRRIDARQPHPSSPKRQCVSIHHPDVADLDEFTGSTCGGGKGCRHQEQSPNPCTGFVRETSASYCLFPQSFAVFCAFPSMREPVIFPVKPEMTVISSGGGFGWRWREAGANGSLELISLFYGKIQGNLQRNGNFRNFNASQPTDK